MLFANEHVAGCAPARGPRESPNDANDRAIRSVAATFAAICGADGDPLYDEHIDEITEHCGRPAPMLVKFTNKNVF